MTPIWEPLGKNSKMTRFMCSRTEMIRWAISIKLIIQKNKSNMLDWKFLRSLWILRKHILLWIFFLLLAFFVLMSSSRHRGTPHLWKFLALLKDIPQPTPFSLPTPKSFPILWAWTWQGYVKQIPSYSCALQQNSSGLVVLFPALLQSLWMIWDRHN